MTEIDKTLVNLKKDHETVTQEKENEKPGKKEVIYCKECDTSFERNCDFEKHIDEHKLQKEFNCDICGLLPQVEVVEAQGNAHCN